MHIQRFNAFPAGSSQARKAAARKAINRASARRKPDTAHEFTRLCGTIIVIAEEGRPVTVNELTDSYRFTPIFIQSHGARAAAHVAQTRPDLAEALGHMKGAQ